MRMIPGKESAYGTIAVNDVQQAAPSAISPREPAARTVLRFARFFYTEAIGGGTGLEKVTVDR